ncbi:MAG TPA: beta-1,6-N-acetylglucosaminyltransferase [Chitinophagaceae bacterium]|nr:beta-1,6-N-acetylglucosaminyltransferase [Chitinophagaceae bacterium]
MYQPLCILIMAHDHEILLRNLLRRLTHPQVLVFVHIDKKSSALFLQLSGTPGIKLIQNRVNVQWAHISQAEAVFASYKEIIAGGYSFAHFIVISGQDYPIRPLPELLKFLADQREKSFLSYAPLSNDGWRLARKRYRYYYYVPAEKLWRGIMMLTGIRRRFPLRLIPYGGAQWINLAREHMDYVIEFWDRNPEMAQFMKTARFPEEIIFQSILLNSAFQKHCVNNDLRFVKWLPGKSNPEILTEEYKQEIMDATDKYFARKFDTRLSAALIDSLDNVLS